MPQLIAENILREDLDNILLQTAHLWDEIRGQRIFITGGTGFFGCWLLESFCWINAKLSLNAEAWVLTRNPEAFKNKCPHLANDPAVTLYKGDIVNFDFPQGKFSHVIHAAVYNDLSQNNDKNINIYNTIIGGLQHTLEFAGVKNISKLLLTSTGAVYGSSAVIGKKITEEDFNGRDPAEIKNFYCELRRICETLCVIYSQRYKIEMKIARGFAFLGPYLPLTGQFAIGNFIHDAMSGNNIVVKGDGAPYRSYMYASDMTIWLWTILFSGKNCRPYNVGSQDAISIKDLAALIAENFDFKSEVNIIDMSNKKKQVDFYIPDTSRAIKELNLQQAVLFTEGLYKTIKWIKATNK
jgi:nucleoside-diphosphate-sugar epimerase